MREYNVGAVYINDNVYAGETNIPLLKGNQGYSISRVVKTSGTGTPGSYDTYTIYINTDPESIVGTFQVWNGTGNIGDMTKAEYDTDNDGIVDNAERVNNHTVDIDVPSNAKFTDTVYDDTAITNRVTTLENAGYITKSVSDLVNYYTKTQTYTKQEVNTLVDTIPKFSIEVVNSLPTQDISTTTIYLVRDDSSTGDIYKEYIYVNNTWEILGTQRVDLSNYYTKQETYNKTEVDTAISQAGGNEIVIGTEEDITRQTKALIKRGNYRYINSEIDNQYGTATNKGYSQEYINDLVINSIRTKNMFGNYPIINGWLDGNIIRVNRTGTERLAFIECKPNTTYTLSRTTKTSKFRIGSYSGDVPAMTNGNVDYNLENYVKDDNATSITITSGANAKYLIVEYCQLGTDSLDTILASLKSMQLEEGSTATTFTKYQALNIDTFDTGWVDLSSYVNTTNFTIRPGYKPEARRIGNIVYLRGEIYCTTAPSGSTATLINNTMPSIFRPNVQYSNCGVTFQKNKVYNIFISNAGIQVSQTAFETTGQFYGYQLSNLSGFIADD